MAFRPRFWRRFWARAPRQLQVNKEGKFILAITVAVGLAAINTGNNLLFLCWGILLSAIVLSGVLSEACLRGLDLTFRVPSLPRVGEAALVQFFLRNSGSKIPAFAVDIGACCRLEKKDYFVDGPFTLKVSPKSQSELFSRFTPVRRGYCEIVYSQIQTAYPFGFFSKSRRFQKKSAHGFWVAPKKIPIKKMNAAFFARLGQESAHRIGSGEEFFALTPYQEGDDLRRVHWPSSARTATWMIRQNQSQMTRRILFEFRFHPYYASRPEKAEELLAVVASLAEQLLAENYMVGIKGPGIYIAPSGAGRQLAFILLELAKLDFTASIPAAPLGEDSFVVGVAHQGGAFLPVSGTNLWVEDCVFTDNVDEGR